MQKKKNERRSMRFKRFKICTLITTSIFLFSMSGKGKNYASKMNIPVVGTVIAELEENISAKLTNSTVSHEKLLSGINTDNLTVDQVNNAYAEVRSNQIINQINQEEITKQKNREIEAKNAAYKESVKRRKENLKLEKLKAKRKKLIEKYANIFNLKNKPTIKIVKNETNWFTKNSLKKKAEEKFELSVLKKIRDIRLNPTSHDADLGKISEYDYKKDETIRKMVIHYANLYGIDPKKALAIELHETALYTSDVCKRRNNVGGMRTRNNAGMYYYYYYDNIERGIIEHMNCLLNYQGKSFDEMQGVYGMDPLWSKKVSKYYNALSDDINAYTIYDEAGTKEKAKINIKK